MEDIIKEKLVEIIRSHFENLGEINDMSIQKIDDVNIITLDSFNQTDAIKPDGLEYSGTAGIDFMKEVSDGNGGQSDGASIDFKRIRLRIDNDKCVELPSPDKILIVI